MSDKSTTYTHLCMVGLHWRDSLEVDPILNRNRAWHAGNLERPGIYKALCGKRVHIDDRDSAWSGKVHTAEGTVPNCKKCRRILHLVGIGLPVPPPNYVVYWGWTWKRAGAYPVYHGGWFYGHVRWFGTKRSHALQFLEEIQQEGYDFCGLKALA